MTDPRAIAARGETGDAGVSVVIPVYNSEQTLGDLVPRVAKVLDATGRPFEIVLVDDGSRDGSLGVVEELVSEVPGVVGVALTRNFGQHNALVAGIALTRYGTVVTMDDDLQHLPEEVPRLLDALTDEVDLVYGVPTEEEHGIWRSVASRIVKAALASAVGAKAARSVSAFRAFPGSLRPVLAENHDAFVSLDVLLSWATASVVAVPVEMRKREHGASNYTFSKLVRHSLNMITGYSTAPLRFVSLVGVVMAMIGAATLAYVLGRWAVGQALPGFTFLAAAVALFSGAQLLALGILGEYLGRMHFRSMQRPVYLIRRIIRDETAMRQTGSAAHSPE